MLVAGLLMGVMLAAGTTPSEPTVSRVSVRQDLLCFASPIELDWEAIARRELESRQISIARPPRHQLRRESEGGDDYYLDYTGPVPELLSRSHFYLLSERGVVPLRPQRLYGSIRYRRGAAPVEPQFTGGEVCSPKPHSVADAGFVFASSTPIEWNWRRAETISDGQELLVRLASGASRLPLSGVKGHPAAVKTLLIVGGSVFTTRYLFVRRVSDDACIAACCEFAYDLYRWEPGLPQILWSGYGCDV